VALIAWWPLAGAAAEEGVDQALRAIRDQARLIEDQVREEPMPPWLTPQTASAKSDTEPVQELAEQASAIAQSAREPLEAAVGLGADGDVGPAVRFTLFASRSLGDGQLRDLFAFAAA
jgi:conjugal transfer pilus assembly protein TraW